MHTTQPLRVGATSRASYIADVIASAVRKNGRIELEAIGPQAAQQIAKAVSLANSYLTPDAIQLMLTPVLPQTALEEPASVVRYVVQQSGASTDDSEDAGPIELAVRA